MHVDNSGQSKALFLARQHRPSKFRKIFDKFRKASFSGGYPLGKINHNTLGGFQ
jgi:hypothetical protein